MTQAERERTSVRAGELADGAPQAIAATVRPAPEGGFDLDHHLFYWFTQVIGRRDRLLTSELRPFGLRVTEWRVLAGLRSRQRCSMGELADIANFDQTTLSRTIDRMVQSGWVKRLADEADMRVTRLALTPKGHALFDEIWPIVERLNKAAVSRLPAGAVELLCVAMREMRRSLDTALGDERAPRNDS